MDFYELVHKRKSCRKYTEENVELSTVKKILDTGRLAPSWKNSQCWEFIIINDKNMIKKLGNAIGNNPNQNVYENVPYVIIMCAHPEKSGSIDGKEYYMLDCGIAFEHICLAASAEGLGTCWVGLFNEEKVKKLLNIPDTVRVVALSPLGYPDGELSAKPRQELENIIHYNSWK